MLGVRSRWPRCWSPLSSSPHPGPEVAQQGKLRVSLPASCTPRQLPRTRPRPGRGHPRRARSPPPTRAPRRSCSRSPWRSTATPALTAGACPAAATARSSRRRQNRPSELPGRAGWPRHLLRPRRAARTVALSLPRGGVAFNGVLGRPHTVAHTSHPDRPRPFLADSDSDLAPRPNGFPSPTERGWPSASPSPTGRGWPSAPRTQGAKRALHVSNRGRRSPQCQPRPVILAHIYGTTPLPQSQLLIFEIHRRPGAFGTSLVAQLPQVAAEWGYVSGIKLTFKRTFRYRGKRHSFVSAGCPAPKDLQVVPFSLARASFDFEDGRIVVSTIGERCRALE